MTIVANILRGYLVDADQDLPVEQLVVQDGKLFVAGQRYEVLFMGDHRNEFIGLGTDENGLSCIRSRCRWFDGLRDRDEEFLWRWGDVMLVPVISTKEVPA